VTGTETTKIFADRLSDLMADRGLGPRTVAAAVGIGHASISKYTDDKAEPGINSLVKLADYFGVSLDYLAGRTDVESPNDTIQGVADYTGLSEKAINALRSIREKDLTSEDVYEYVPSLVGRLSPEARSMFNVNFVLEHPAFKEFIRHADHARYQQWRTAKGVSIEQTKSVFHIFESYVRGEDKEAKEDESHEWFELEQYRATKQLSRAIEELCLIEKPPLILEYGGHHAKD